MLRTALSAYIINDTRTCTKLENIENPVGLIEDHVVKENPLEEILWDEIKGVKQRTE